MSSIVSKKNWWWDCAYSEHVICGICVCTLHQRPCMMSKCSEHMELAP